MFRTEQQDRRKLFDPFALIRAFLITVIVLTTIYSVREFGPRIERAWFPVVGPLQITNAVSISETQTRIWVRFRKLRECPPIEVFWYRGSRDGLFERIPYTVEKPINGQKYFNRPLGDQNSGPWIIGVPIEELKTGVFADVHHDCNALWPTVSRFYN